ncbi:glycosyltransferase 87 family protein [Allokutzneria sp. A3M-2-11 16]|uniref:glycosyltransferase 87 family protein n=1 Tax=Allokutzneria sp. A3M-2-11 16 TaxID=2962043 RepID=UPI0020B72935|nr:glycosyltransferase 87 family protein [Allokutzneria sp. A3M-2-11 16]MCP3801157.1 glycosyltransferase 87 family protein [Allokutzneria sp. A3M-2-11 16]
MSRAFTILVYVAGLAMAVRTISGFAIDLGVYRAGGQAVLDGAPMYENELFAGLLFTYTPFAALIFVPLALLPMIAAQSLVALGNYALLTYSLTRSWQALDKRKALALALLMAAPLLLTEAVRVTHSIGQVNLALLALVLWDLLRDDSRRTKGIGVGIAAGIKLTPLFFVAYLVITRRFRAAATAMAGFVGTIAVGFLLLPKDSTRFWFGGTFADAARVFPDVAAVHNQSLRGMVLRAFGGLSPETQDLWIVLAAVVTIGTLALAAWASQRGEELLAVTLCGLCAATVSPWSWGHHWVWIVPLAAIVVRKSWWVLAPLLALTFPKLHALAAPNPGVTEPPVLQGNPLAFLLGNIYVIIFAATVVAAIVHLLRRDDIGSSSRPEGMDVVPWKALEPSV